MGCRRFVLAALIVLLSACSLAGAATERARVVLNREGLSARDNTNFGAVPDTGGAIGRGRYIEVVNPRIAIYDAKLRLLASRDAYAFWHRSHISQIVDPFVVWDDQARRFYLVSLFNGTGGKNNQLLFAWTKRGRPLNLADAWCRMTIRVGALFDDFPKLGFDRAHIVIGTNLFNATASPPQFLSARIWVLGKPTSQRGCSRLPVRSFGSPSEPLRRADGHLAFTPVPVVSATPAAQDYVVAADCVFQPEPGEEPPACGARDRKANQLTVWRVTGPRAAPRLVRDGGVDVPVYQLPHPAAQPGTTSTIDTSDTRLYQAVSAPDPTKGIRQAIWTQHAVEGPGGRSEVRWYEIDPKGPRLLRSGTIRSATDSVFSGAISPTSNGKAAVLVYVVSGRDRLPELLAQDVLGGRAIKLARSSHPLLRSKCGADPGQPCAWGDYAAATPDPVDKRLVWESNELVGSPKHPGPLRTYWRTWNAAIRASVGP